MTQELKLAKLMRTFRAHPSSDAPSNPILESWSDAVQDAGWTYLTTGRPDVLLVHWPFASLQDRNRVTAIAKSSARLLAYLSLRLRGTRLVYVVHNMIPHDSTMAWFSGLMMRAFYRLCSGFIFLSNASLVEFTQGFSVGGKPSTVTGHGPYNVDPVAQRPEHKTFTLGFFGRLEPYKGIDRILPILQTPSASNWNLKVWGAASRSDYIKKLDGLCSDRVDLRVGWIEDSDLIRLAAEVDLFVFPFRTITNSGSVVMALCLGRPVAVTSTPAMLEMQQRVGSDWLYLLQEDDLETSLKDAAAWVATIPRGVADLRSRLVSWADVGAQTVNVFRRVIHGD